MRAGFGVVRNETGVEQCFGLYSVPPHSFGELPSEVITSLLRHPMRELTVIQQEIGPQVFRRTEHVPGSIRYQERARGSNER